MRRFRKAILALLLPWTSFVIVMGTILVFGLQFYTEKLASGFLESWLQAEAVSIQEGNLLTSLSKNQRVLLSSDVIEGISLLRSGADARYVLEKPIELGRYFEVPHGQLPVEAGRVHILRPGLFEAIGVYRIPENPELCVAFLAHVGFAPWLVMFFVIFVGVATFLVLFTAYRTISSEHSTRLQVVSSALSDLVDDRPLSSNLDIAVPGISSAWNALKSRLEGLKLEVARQSQLAAVARTTQALAHDVRKPFSMFKSIIQIVEGTDDPAEVREVLKLTLPEVNQAMASVEGMISDVMQIGSDAQMNTEDVSPETLIEAALGELFRIYHEADVDISYELFHRHGVQADTLRVGRVFSNILGNAVQAMGEKGNLWIKTREKDGLIEFTLGNAGSFIPAESLSKLFDAFFTSDKKGGTGLGLAIAKKIIEAHGGTIRALSEKNEKHPSGMVEFVFTLSVSATLCTPRAEVLPRSSREIQSALAAVRIASARKEGQGPDPREAELESAVLARICGSSTPNKDKVTVLVVEDEAVYRNGLLALLDRSEGLSAHIRIVCAKNHSEALAAAAEFTPALVIEDVDLGAGSQDGLWIVKTLREKGFAGHICVHSNRFLVTDTKAALTAGADTILPKPMGRAHFLKLILASIPTAQALAPDVPAQPGPLNVALVDDSITMRMGWRTTIGIHTAYLGFRGSQEFWAACAQDAGYLDRLDVIVTDYNFAPDDPEDGGTFARALRERGYRGLIFRASGEGDLGAEIEALFDADVGKSPLKGEDFLARVATARQARDRV